MATLDLGGNLSVSLPPVSIDIGAAHLSDPFWLETIKHQGTAAFNPNPGTYKVFRNVKDFGAKGDGKTDDTDAINLAISTGNRVGVIGNTSTVTPALVYFPSGTYLVKAPIIALYYTALVGDAKNRPTLLADANFTGMAVIDADPYIPNGNGAQYYINQDNFFRSVRNIKIDLRQMPVNATATGLHWQVSQATSLYNVQVDMSTEPDNQHQGIFMENGSGGFMGDLVFNGGKYGIWVGNQQFTVRNLRINNAQVGIHASFNWGWTFQGLHINNCKIGLNMTTGGLTAATQTVGAETIIDAHIKDTATFIHTTSNSTGSLAGSILLDNIHFENVDVGVTDPSGKVFLKGTKHTKTIRQWARGNVYAGTAPKGKFIENLTHPDDKPWILLDPSSRDGGEIFGRTRPQYEDYSVEQFVSAKSHGAKGDGRTDDTKALQTILDKAAGCKIIFLDAGTYIVTDTLRIPPGTRMVGEAWSQIMISGPKYENIHKPHVGVQVGTPGSVGFVELTDILFVTKGPSPGAIVVEWNIEESHQGAAGTWDTHVRLGGAAGTGMGDSTCSNVTTTPDSHQCYASYLAFHLTEHATAYLEGLWVWLADHDLDGENGQITLYSGRGILSESRGPVWMIGTASEHHVLYEYSLVNAKNHYMGVIQTESPYYQPNPKPPAPFSIDSSLHDPKFTPAQPSAWGLHVTNSRDILIYGAGLYSFFQNYLQVCLDTTSCQPQIANIDSNSDVQLYSLSTVGTTYQLSVDNVGIINQKDNIDGFAQTATIWNRARF